MDKIEEVLTRGVEEILPSKEALAKLMQKQKIRLYNGIDPTSPHIHLGNTVPLLKLKQFQDLGHEVILLIGTFTAQIGDPSGHDETRKPLAPRQIKKNIATYKQQASKILEFSKVKLVFNDAWLSKLSFIDVIKLSTNFTVQQIIKRDLFQRRLKSDKEIWLNEFLYPLAQGYDSAHLNVDLEIGATEQLFNMLIGRDLQKTYNQKEKFVMTLPLIPGLDGRKMSKTYGNTINITDPPRDMFGKIMSMKDELIIQYFELLTEVPLQLIKEYKKALQSIKVNPMDLKKKLAWEIVKMYHGKKEADKAQKEFERVYQKRQLPKKVRSLELGDRSWNLVDLLIETKLVKSKSQAKRLISQGAVEVNQSAIRNPQSAIKIKDGMIIKVGKKRFVKISNPKG